MTDPQRVKANKQNTTEGWHLRQLYSSKLSITIHEKRKTFHDKNKHYLCTSIALQKALEGQLQSEEVNCTKETEEINNPQTVI